MASVIALDNSNTKVYWLRDFFLWFQPHLAFFPHRAGLAWLFDNCYFLRVAGFELLPG
jgi:hypothetical protein